MHRSDAEIEATAEAIVNRIMAQVDPVIRRAVDEVMGESVTVYTETTVGDTTTFTVRSNRPITGPVGDFNAFLAERGIADPSVTKGAE